MKTQRRMPPSVVVWTCIFYGIILFVAVSAWRDAGPIRSTLILILFVIAVVHRYFIVHGNLQNVPLIKKNKNVIFVSGVMAVAESQLEQEWAGQETLKVAIRKEDCPEEEWERLPGAKGFFAFMSGMVHLTITRRRGIIQEITGANCEVNEGAFIIYSGVSKDTPVIGLNEQFEMENNYLHGVIKKIHTVVQTAMSEISRDTQAGRKSTADVIHELAPILREIGQRFPAITQSSQQQV